MLKHEEWKSDEGSNVEFQNPQVQAQKAEDVLRRHGKLPTVNEESDLDAKYRELGQMYWEYITERFDRTEFDVKAQPIIEALETNLNNSTKTKKSYE